MLYKKSPSDTVIYLPFLIISSSSSHTSGGPLGGPQTIQTGHSTMGIQINNNNIGPSGTRPLEKPERDENGFPAEEGVLMALAFQAKGLQEQVLFLLQSDFRPQFHRAV